MALRLPMHRAPRQLLAPALAALPVVPRLRWCRAWRMGWTPTSSCTSSSPCCTAIVGRQGSPTGLPALLLALDCLRRCFQRWTPTHPPHGACVRCVCSGWRWRWYDMRYRGGIQVLT